MNYGEVMVDVNYVSSFDMYIDMYVDMYGQWRIFSQQRFLLKERQIQ